MRRFNALAWETQAFDIRDNVARRNLTDYTSASVTFILALPIYIHTPFSQPTKEYHQDDIISFRRYK